jgi:hypothetical protein
VTCGSAGFDKPRTTIYRGAFSNDRAPVWAEVMKATFADYRPQEIPKLKGITNAICAAPGCSRRFKCGVGGEQRHRRKMTRRTTFRDCH